MKPWDFKMGQIVGYKPRGELWRAKVTAIERDGKSFLAEIPVVDEQGEPIRYEDPPTFVSPIMDYENYYLIQDVTAKTDPWIAARLDHQDVGAAWKSFAEKIGLKEPYYQALATLMDKYVAEGSRGEFMDDLLVLLHGSWRAGMASENGDCQRLLRQRCDSRGINCLAHCTHQDDVEAIRARLRG